MNQSESAPARSRWLGCLLAPVIGAAVVVGVNAAFWLITGQPLAVGDEWDIYLFQMLLIAAPFGVLALAGVNGKGPWLAGGALTALFWGDYLYAGIHYQLSGDRSGADIGLGIIMLISPVVICIVCGIVAKASR